MRFYLAKCEPRLSSELSHLFFHALAKVLIAQKRLASSSNRDPHSFEYVSNLFSHPNFHVLGFKNVFTYFF